MKNTLLLGICILVLLSGELEVTGISSDGTGQVVCIKADGNLGTCSDAPDGSGVCTCG